MGSMMYRMANKLRLSMLNLPQGQQLYDLSKGQECLPVGFYGKVSDASFNPLSSTYLPHTVHIKISLFYQSLGACKCTENCSATAGSGCFCVSLNDGELPYNNSGVLLHGKHMVFECGPQCSCPPTCTNRVSQKGLKRRLQVFQSEEIRSWELRSLDFILAGTFICEITGNVTYSPSFQNQSRNNTWRMWLSIIIALRIVSWCFKQSCHAGAWSWGNNITQVFPGYKPLANWAERFAHDVSDLVIDMTNGRNVGCYLSNSKTPNVFAQFVLFDHHDMTMPHVMVFALQDILPMTELTLDYGYGANRY